MSYQLQATPTKGTRHTGLLVVGIVLLLAALGVGAALFVASGSQYEDAVQDLQRAPVGCDTDFEFTGTGTFYFYLETKGAVGDLRGDCENANSEYDNDDRPRVTLTLTNADGEEVDLDRSDDVSYDKGGFAGTAIRTITLDEPGSYTLAVDSDDSDFAIAVGRNPKDDADQLRTVAIIVAAAGAVVGLLFIALGLRRKTVPAGPASSGFGSDFGGGPTAPPVGQAPPPPFGPGPPHDGPAPGTSAGSPPFTSPPPPPGGGAMPPPPPGNWGSPRP